MSELTTSLAVEAVAWERAPRYDGRSVNLRIVCADGFAISVQASGRHYANDSSGSAPYWHDNPTAYPFTTFEVGYPTAELPTSFDEYDSGGVWAWVPRHLVEALLDAHGGAVAWQQPPADDGRGEGA